MSTTDPTTSPLGPTTPPSDKIDWSNLGFNYRDTNGYIKYTWTNGEWDTGVWETDPYLKVHVASTGLNYGQECFEGLKAFRCKDGRVRVFRPHANANRMIDTAHLASMVPVPEEIFLDAVRRTVTGNLEFIPPYGSGGSAYLRPLLFGNGPMLALDPAPVFTFVVFVVPVGSYYSNGAKPVDAWVVEDFDRAAPFGTGSAKLGGNYAPVFRPTKEAKERGYAITLHLDSATRSHIDEFSTSNFVALTHADPTTGHTTLVTPNSPSILRSVTRSSLVQLARSFGWSIEERMVLFKELEDGAFAEVAACGTAAIITPVKKVVKGERVIDIGGGANTERIGPGFEKLLNAYKAIQGGNVEDPYGWMWPAEGF
ncbi:branched-chain amino acid aminotransferase [Jimgerdemannia flammicorona]|uniref:Branched-chain amino acid aminotransferase n=1 Tax=Jimgerdemannia flammicorona TaxID=994334 RepID=A0A433QMV2_9FUNG|nr:branched-chain amino acid aminotransferase [Jimgerdemannia flammicorona]